MNEHLPIAIIGAGPIGLAAAARLLERNLAPKVLEAGSQAGASILEWSHVHLFSPWRFNIDAAARALLDQEGWRHPDPGTQPTGEQLVNDYLAPLAAHPAMAPHITLGARVVAVSRLNRSKLDNADRDKSPFVVVWQGPGGEKHRLLARAVIDASGTWMRPNPMGRDGLPAEGEVENGHRIAYGIPDILGSGRQAYAGKHTLVVGAGHSAINAALDLIDLKAQNQQTTISWATRSGGAERLLGGGLDDALPGRGLLGHRAASAVRNGEAVLFSPFTINRIRERTNRLMVEADTAEGIVVLEVDRIIVATGFRPDLSFLSEIRIQLDPSVEATPALAPLIDPNIHSCGTVRPHGAMELTHPEPDFYIVGAKSYGRAPTFLLATGYEQVRSVAAMLAGEVEAALRVELELPETGVCRASTSDVRCCGKDAEPLSPKSPSLASEKEITMSEQAVRNKEADDGAQTSGCCGGPAPTGVDACCVKDADAKAAGEGGCGCGSAPAPKAEAKQAACCN